jgi:hypothetical protein
MFPQLGQFTDLFRMALRSDAGFDEHRHCLYRRRQVHTLEVTDVNRLASASRVTFGGRS